MAKGDFPDVSSQRSRGASWKAITVTAIVSATVSLYAERRLLPLAPESLGASLGLASSAPTAGAARQCRPPLPNLFAQTPISNSNPKVRKALHDVDTYVRKSFAEASSAMDGLAVAVITANGAIYEAGLGPLKANETDLEKRGVIDRHSIFRIASGSKLFAVLETLILREKGALQWDDPVDKFFPGFTYISGGWSDFHSTPASLKSKPQPQAPITLRQLATHMSGLTREYPRGDMKTWPHSLSGAGPPPLNGCPFPTIEETIEGLKEYPLVVPTYSYPVYSNAGMAVLGQVAVVANREYEKAKNVNEREIPGTWQELVRRDVFGPLGMNGSDFVVTPENRAHVTVAATNSDEVDLDFLDTMSSSGGQMSSLSDYTKIMQTILDPTRPEALLPPHVIREWLRPLHGWSDDTTEVGMLWEIEKVYDSYGRPIRIYTKSGVLSASRSVFAVNQDMSYGVALLMTGTLETVGDIALNIFKHIQPTLDLILAQQVSDLYSGIWVSGDGNSTATIEVSGGSLWINSLVLEGTDVLHMTQGLNRDDGKEPMPITMWSTGRTHEFRMVFGAPEEFGAIKYSTCVRYWVSMDVGFSRGYPIDLMYFVRDEGTGELILHVPSASVTLVRQ